MTTQMLVAVVGGVGMTVAAVASGLGLGQRAEQPRIVARIGAIVSLVVSVVYLAFRIYSIGLIQALELHFIDTLLLGTLIALMGLCTHVSRRLQGIDVILFGLAGVIYLAALTVGGHGGETFVRRPWFVSHTLAFAASGALFVAGGVAGIVYLFVNRILRRKRSLRLVGKLASLESLESFGRWMPLLGFPLFTYGILTGFCGVAHRPDIGESRWYLDPTLWFAVGAWAVYAFLCFGSLYLPQIRGRRAAVISTYGCGLVVMLFFIREFLSPIHR